MSETRGRLFARFTYLWLMRGRWQGLVGLAFCAVVGCGGKAIEHGKPSDDQDANNGRDANTDHWDTAPFEGIYQLTGASENTVGCSTPGESKLGQLSDQFFTLVGLDVLGRTYLDLISCSDIADCRAKRAALLAREFFPIQYSFMLSGSTNSTTTLQGFQGGSGEGRGTICVGRIYAEQVLTLAADHSVHVESRTKKLGNLPQSDGFCTVEPAEWQKEAADQECSSLQVFDAKFVQGNTN